LPASASWPSNPRISTTTVASAAAVAPSCPAACSE